MNIDTNYDGTLIISSSVVSFSDNVQSVDLSKKKISGFNSRQWRRRKREHLTPSSVNLVEELIDASTNTMHDVATQCDAISTSAVYDYTENKAKQSKRTADDVTTTLLHENHS